MECVLCGVAWEYHWARIQGHEFQESDAVLPWCCMACCAAGQALPGHFACAPTAACGHGTHEATCHGQLA